MMYTAKQQQETLNKMVDFISTRIHSGAAFRVQLKCNFVNRSGSWGGMQKNKPVMQIGLNDNGRHTNKEQWLAHLTAKNNNGIKRSWKQAHELASKGHWCYVEYSHIHKDPKIGGFVSDDPTVHSDALLAHELAHAVQYWCMYKNDTQFGTDFTAHKGVFQNIYRILREEFVNHRIGTSPFAMDVADMPEPVARPATPAYVTPKKAFSKKRSGAVAQCFALFDELRAEGILERKVAMLAGLERGINKSTLGRQWVEWGKARGLR